jgi:hypothetical protein
MTVMAGVTITMTVTVAVAGAAPLASPIVTPPVNWCGANQQVRQGVLNYRSTDSEICPRPAFSWPPACEHRRRCRHEFGRG